MRGGTNRWQRVEAILDRVFELPEADWASYLAEACGEEPELRAELEAILAADRAAGDHFMETPALQWVSLGDEDGLFGAPEEPAPPAFKAGAMVGPYRLLRELGRGGMGEVFEAHDERLDRAVALKRVRFQHGATQVQRRRFRREARLAAGLDHPSIVRIHDLLDWKGEDWLVMELLDGQPLKRVMGSGALPEARVLRLARQIAGALVEAHAAGILHRDLKSENVLVDGEDQAKLLDFGLAKRIGRDPALIDAPLSVAEASDPALPAVPNPEGRLTLDNQILGTLRAMSPEQALGRPLDARSDLFSFGVLLYEMATGVTPFAAVGSAATIQAICHQPHKPAREVAPSVSRGLSALIDRLLEKDPSRRPQSAGAVVSALGLCLRSRSRRRFQAISAGLVAALVALASWFWSQREPVSPRYVAVLEPVLAASDVAGAELMAAGVYAATQSTLSRLRGLAALPVDGGGVGGDDGAETVPVEAARALGAEEALTAKLNCPGVRCELMLSRIAAADGRVLWLGNLEIPMDELPLLEAAVSNRLREAYSDYPAESGELPTIPHEAYLGYLRLRQAFRTHQPPVGDDLLAALAALRQQHPEFLEPYLLEAEVSRARFRESHEPRRLRRSLDLLEAAGRLAPSDRRVPEFLFDLAQESGQWELAREALGRIQRLEPGGAAALQHEAELLAHEGRGEEALALMRRAIERRPALHYLFNLALMEYQQGEIEAARVTLETLLAREPEDFDAASFLAQLELMTGSPRRAVELYQGLVARAPSVAPSASLSINLGTAHLLVGDYRQAELQFVQAFDQEPGNAIAALNLADSLALQGEDKEAASLYARTLELATEDSALDAWQRWTLRGQALAHLGRSAEAREAVEAALFTAPENPNVALEAALVFALIQEESEAVRQVGRALDMGLDRRWFQLPWFSPLEANEEFRRRVAPGR